MRKSADHGFPRKLVLPDLKTIRDDLVEQRHELWAHTDEVHFDERPLIKSYPKAMIPEFRRLIETVLDSIEIYS